MSKFVTTTNIVWRIENFPSVQKKISPIIRMVGLKFHVNFHQYLDSGAPKVQLILVCQNASPTLPPLQFDINTSFLNSSGNRYLPKSGKYDLTKECLIWSDLISSITKTLGTINDVTFLIMITPSGDSSRIFEAKLSFEEVSEMTPCAVSLSEDMGSLLDSPKCSDFTLLCGDKSLPVHKTVLSARSHFFAGMFRSDMKESNENNSTIKDIEPDILEVVLRYMYTAKVPHLSMDYLQKVYAAADRLIVEPLKMKCYSLFINNITNESEESSETEIESEELLLDKEPNKKESDKKEKDAKKRQMLKDLFMSKEWRLFNDEFPHDAHEMCKPFFFPVSK